MYNMLMLSTKKFNNQAVAGWLLRLGLAFVFLYAASGTLMHPHLWQGFLPSFVQDFSFVGLILKGLALYEIALAVWLLSGKFLRYAGLLCAATLAGIILAQPSDLIVTFRDVGLVCMALALAAIEK